MKTNKSFTKRVKVTKNKKLVVRTPGGSHFNAKESRTKQLARKKGGQLKLTRKELGRFLPSV